MFQIPFWESRIFSEFGTIVIGFHIKQTPNCALMLILLSKKQFIERVTYYMLFTHRYFFFYEGQNK